MAEQITRSRSGTLSVRKALPMFVAPTVDGKLFNTLRQGLEPIACFAIAAPGFAFDSSLLLPEMRAEFVKLGRLLERFPDHPVSVFGHADPTGSDDYNKELSGRRTLSVYALLTHQPALWEQLFTSSSKASGDDWNQRHLMVMLGQLFSPSTGKPYFSGTPTASKTAATDAAIRAFQEDHELAVDGIAGPKTREKLFGLYMDLLTEAGDDSGAPPSKIALKPENFLGKGADADGKADYQSCSEFNPAVVLSKQDADTLSKEDRDQENAANRRVVIYLFKRGTEVDVGKWPCPTIKQPAAGCRARFWSDGEKRRSPGPERRTFDVTQDTFACRFYHRIAGGSPCERPAGLTFVAEIFFDLPTAQKAVPQSFTLISSDLSFKQTLGADATVRVDDKTAVLVFTGVRRGKVYALSYDLGDGKQVPIFAGVPLDALDDFGDDTAAPEALALADEPAPEEPANDGTGDELLALNDVDKKFDPNLIDPDPGTAIA